MGDETQYIYTLVRLSDRRFEVHLNGLPLYIFEYPRPATRKASAHVKLLNEAEQERRRKAFDEDVPVLGVIADEDAAKPEYIHLANRLPKLPELGDEPRVVKFGDGYTHYVDIDGTITREREAEWIRWDDELEEETLQALIEQAADALPDAGATNHGIRFDASLGDGFGPEDSGITFVFTPEELPDGRWVWTCDAAPGRIFWKKRNR